MWKEYIIVHFTIICWENGQILLIWVVTLFQKRDPILKVGLKNHQFANDFLAVSEYNEIIFSLKEIIIFFI